MKSGFRIPLNLPWVVDYDSYKTLCPIFGQENSPNLFFKHKEGNPWLP